MGLNYEKIRTEVGTKLFDEGLRSGIQTRMLLMALQHQPELRSRPDMTPNERYERRQRVSEKSNEIHKYLNEVFKAAEQE